MSYCIKAILTGPREDFDTFRNLYSQLDIYRHDTERAETYMYGLPNISV